TFPGTEAVVGNQSEAKQSEPPGNSRPAGRRWPACHRAGGAVEALGPSWILKRALRLERRQATEGLAGARPSRCVFDRFDGGRCNSLPLLFSERMRFAFLVYLFTAVTSLHAEQPFDFASTPGKLPKQIRPIDYAVWFKPDLKKLTFSGRETV